jgi:hypothetical protein
VKHGAVKCLVWRSIFGYRRKRMKLNWNWRWSCSFLFLF